MYDLKYMAKRYFFASSFLLNNHKTLVLLGFAH